MKQYSRYLFICLSTGKNKKLRIWPSVTLKMYWMTLNSTILICDPWHTTVLNLNSLSYFRAGANIIFRFLPYSDLENVLIDPKINKAHFAPYLRTGLGLCRYLTVILSIMTHQHSTKWPKWYLAYFDLDLSDLLEGQRSHDPSQVVSLRY